MTKNLVKNIGIYVFFNSLGQGLIFLLWFLLALKLEPLQISVYVLSMFVIEFFSAINIFGLDSAMTRFYYAKNNVSLVFSNVLNLLFLTSLLTFFLFLVSAVFLLPLLVPEISAFIKEQIYLFSAIIIFNTLVNFSLAHYISIKEAFNFVILNLLKISIFFLSAIILVWLKFGVLGLFYGFLLSCFAAFLFFVAKELKSNVILRPSFQISKELIYYAFPLMVYTIFGVFISYFSRLLLSKFTDFNTLGVYSFFLAITLQVKGLWSTFNRAWTPEIFSGILKEKVRTHKNVEFAVFLISFFYLLGLAFLVLVGNLIFKFIFKDIYLSNLNIFYILLLGPLFTGIYTAAYPLYFYQTRTQKILLVSIGIALIDIFLTVFLIRYYNQLGAALSFFAISALTPLFYLLVFRKMLGISKKILNWTILLFFIMFFAFLTLAFKAPYFLFILITVSGAFLSYKLGKLSEKKHLLWQLLKYIKQPFLDLMR